MEVPGLHIYYFPAIIRFGGALRLWSSKLVSSSPACAMPHGNTRGRRACTLHRDLAAQRFLKRGPGSRLAAWVLLHMQHLRSRPCRPRYGTSELQCVCYRPSPSRSSCTPTVECTRHPVLWACCSLCSPQPHVQPYAFEGEEKPQGGRHGAGRLPTWGPRNAP